MRTNKDANWWQPAKKPAKATAYEEAPLEKRPQRVNESAPLLARPAYRATLTNLRDPTRECFHSTAISRDSACLSRKRVLEDQ